MNASEEWDWGLTDSARDRFDVLAPDARERIAGKCDDVVSDPWRDPVDYLEPLPGVPHRKLRIGPYRLGCRLNQETRTAWVLRIKMRGGDVYRGDDWAIETERVHATLAYYYANVEGARPPACEGSRSLD